PLASASLSLGHANPLPGLHLRWMACPTMVILRAWGGLPARLRLGRREADLARRHMARNFDGLLVLDKPGGMTSRDAVDRALRWSPRGTRVGHTGTLDPLATGVLVLCVGSATRLTEYVQQMGKTYRTTVRLGARSDTDDADGTVTPVAGAVAPTREQLDGCLQ